MEFSSRCDSSENEVRILAYGSSALRRQVGVLNFSLAKPCYRQSAVGLLTGASPTFQPQSAAAIRSRRRTPRSAEEILSSGVPRGKVGIGIGKRSRGDRDDEICYKDATLSFKLGAVGTKGKTATATKLLPPAHSTPAKQAVGAKTTTTARTGSSSASKVISAASVPLPAVSGAGARAMFRLRFSRDSSDASTSSACTQDRQNILLERGATAASGSSSSTPHPLPGVLPMENNSSVAAAAMGRMSSARAAALRVLPKTYTAALLKRQEAQQQQQQAQQGRVKRACLKPTPVKNEMASAPDLLRDVSGLRRLSSSSLNEIKAAATAAVGGGRPSTDSNSTASSVPGLYLSPFRRVSNPSSTAASEADSLQPPTPPAAAAVAAGPSCASTPDSSKGAGSISKHGAPAAASAGRSMLLSALDAATAANTKAAAALREAARRAVTHSQAAAMQLSEPAAAPVAAAAAAGTAAAAAPEGVQSEGCSADQEAVRHMVMGWYQPGDDATCVVSAGLLNVCQQQLLQETDDGGQKQQPCSCSYTAAGGATGGDNKQDKCMCGIGYSRLQRGDSGGSGRYQLQLETAASAESSDGLCQVQLQQGKGQVQMQQQKLPGGAVAAAGLTQSQVLLQDTSLLSPFWEKTETVATTVAAVPMPAPVSPSPAAKVEQVHGNATALVPVPAGSAGIDELLAASTQCINRLEASFASMKLAAQLLAEAQLPLRERFSH